MAPLLKTLYFSSLKIMEGVRHYDVLYNRGDDINMVMKIPRRAIILTLEINNRGATIIPNTRVKNLDTGGGDIFCTPAGGMG